MQLCAQKVRSCYWLVNVCGFKNRGAKLSPVPCYLLIIKDKANAWTVDNTTKGEKSDTVVPSTGKLETFLGCAMLRQPHQLVIFLSIMSPFFVKKYCSAAALSNSVSHNSIAPYL